MMNRLVTLFMFMGLLTIAQAQGVDRVRFNNEASDTTRLTALLIDATNQLPSAATPETRMAWFADKFLGTAYQGGTLDGDEEILTINLDGFDCNTYVETVAALALTVGEGRTSWRDFAYNLQRIRYRKGEVDGYASRLHYVSDWIVDNAYRGNVREVTSDYEGSRTVEKTIDYMTRNRDKYPALADQETYERMRNVEAGYRSHRFPHIKVLSAGQKGFARFVEDGDIIAFTTKTPDLDVQHIGFVRLKDGKVYLQHASSLGGAVEMTNVPLAEYLRRNPKINGVRIVRLVP